MLSGINKQKCDAITGEIAILPNGNLLPCGGFVGCHNEDEMIVGDIYKGIDEKKINIYLNNSKKIENTDCLKCLLFDRCQNDCMALNNRVNNDLLKIDSTMCAINQIAIQESDRVLSYLLKTKNKLFLNSYKDFLG